MTYNNFELAFRGIIKKLFLNPEYDINSRNGKTYEQFGLSYTVTDPSTFEFENKNLGRITYEYANHFYDWMISGCSDEATEEFKEKYKHVAGFLEKPKSESLPDNFNVFYGPRIVRQLSAILKELKENKNSRRAVINILTEEDQKLFDAPEDSNLEYPCADSSTFSIRNNRLYQHLHMRSNNMGNVAKLDMYLWGRFQCYLAEELGVELGHFHCSIVSAHIMEKDFDYFFKVGVFDTYITKQKYLQSKLSKLLKTNQLTFIRHQQTIANKDRILQGQSDSALTGELPDLRPLNNKAEIDEILFYSSGLGRSKATLDLILQEMDAEKEGIVSGVFVVDKDVYPSRYIYEVEESDLLNEINWGTYEQTQDPTNYTELDSMVWFYNTVNVIDKRFKGDETSESFGEVIDRFIEFINLNIDKKNTNIVIVGHGLYIQLMRRIGFNETYNRISHLDVVTYK